MGRSYVRYTVGLYNLCSYPHEGDTVQIVSGYSSVPGNSCQGGEDVATIIRTCTYHSGSLLPVVIAVVVVGVVGIVVGIVLLVRCTIGNVYKRLASTDMDEDAVGFDAPIAHPSEDGMELEEFGDDDGDDSYDDDPYDDGSYEDDDKNEEEGESPEPSQNDAKDHV